MLLKKICMLGAFSVGKTSLVQRFVESIFSDRYLTTVGVKISKKIVTVDGRDLTLVLWDLAGEDEYKKVQTAYMKGAAGYILVADGTRLETLELAMSIQKRAESVTGGIPFVFAINKSDLKDSWEISESVIPDLRGKGWHVTTTSAKLGEGVDELFDALARKMI